MNTCLRRISHKLWLWIGSAAFTLVSIIGGAVLHGSMWPAYFLVFLVGALVSSYQVFSDIARENNQLLQRLKEIEDSKPNIQIGLDQDGERVRSLRVDREVPTEPNYDKEVAQRKQLLLAKYDQQTAGKGYSRLLDNVVGSVNPNYAKEVEQYLVVYREYLEKLHQYDLVNTNMMSVHLLLENVGRAKADAVTIELTLPPELSFPDTEHFVATFEKPKPPEEPEVRPDFMAQFGRLSAPGFNLPPIVPLQTGLSNARGPFYHKDAPKTVSYEIGQLVPALEERELKPFRVWTGDVIHDGPLYIRGKIYAANLREPREETLTLDLRSRPRSGQGA